MLAVRVVKRLKLMVTLIKFPVLLWPAGKKEEHRLVAQ